MSEAQTIETTTDEPVEGLTDTVQASLAVQSGRESEKARTQAGIEESEKERIRQENLEVLKRARAKSEKKSVKRGDDGRFSKTDLEPVEPDREDDIASEKVKKADQDSQKQKQIEREQKTMAHEEAIRVLLRDGTFDADELASMEPDKLIAKAEKAKKRQSDVDGYKSKVDNELKELETLRQKLAELESGSAKPGDVSGTSEAAKTTSEPAAATSAVNIAEIVQPISAKLSEVVGEDIDLTPHLQSLGESIIKSIAPELEASRKRNETLQEQLHRILDSSVRPSVAERFPWVNDDPEWEKVRDRASSLVKSGVVSDRTEALKSAAAMMYGIRAAEEAAQAAQAIDRAKTIGQPYSGSQSPKTAPATPQDEASTLLNLRRKGKTLDEAKHLAGLG